MALNYFYEIVFGNQTKHHISTLVVAEFDQMIARQSRNQGHLPVSKL